MTKYNKKQQELTPSQRIDEAIQAFEDGKPKQTNINLTSDDLDLMFNAIINRDNSKYIDMKLLNDMQKIVSAQNPDQYLTDSRKRDLRSLILELLRDIEINHKQLKWSKETFINRVYERYGEMNSYKSILEHVYETPFNFGPDESNELRELLQIKYDMFSKNYLFTILVETINMRNEGNFKNINEINKEIDYVLKRYSEFTSRSINLTSVDSYLGIDIHTKMTEDDIRPIAQKMIEKSKPLLTGLKEFNRMTDGFYRKKLYVFTGVPNTGKTTTLAQFASDIRKYNVGEELLINKNKTPYVLYITLEDAEEDMFNRTLSIFNQKNIYADDHDVNSLTVEAKRILCGACPQADIHLLIKEFQGNSISSAGIREYMIQVERELNAEILSVFVDYSKRVNANDSSVKDEYAQLRDVTNELRALAFEFNCSVITACQINRKGQELIELEQNKGGSSDFARNVGMSSIGGSFAVFENADSIVLINSEFGSKSCRKYMAFKKIKMRYKPKFMTEYFATIINEGGGFTQDFSIVKTTDDPTAANFREQFLSYPSVAEAENEFKKANGINEEGYTTFQANGTSYVKGEIRSQSTDIMSEFTTFQTQNHVSAINTKH